MAGRSFLIDEDTLQFVFRLFGYAGEAMSRRRGADWGPESATPAESEEPTAPESASPDPAPASAFDSPEVRSDPPGIRPDRARGAAERRVDAVEVPRRPPSGESAPFSSPEDPMWAFFRQAMVLAEDELDEDVRPLIRWLEATATAAPAVKGAAKPGSGED